MKLDASQYLLPSEQPPPPVLPFGLEHWSPSSFDMLWRCPRQWQERYIHGRKEAPAEATTIGSTIHAAAERNFGQKITTHEDLPIAELLEWYMDAGFVSVVAEKQRDANAEVRWDSSPEEARTRGRAMLAAYQHDVAPRVQPLAVETWIEVDFGLAVPVKGIFDVETEETVIDLKTGRRKQSEPKESWKIQASIYGEARRKPVEFHHVSTSKTGVVSIVTPLESEALLVNADHHEREEMRRRLQALESMALMFWEIYGPDEPWPTMGRLSTWACDWCGFRSDCPAWKE